MPYDPTKAEPRNPTTGGETAQESADRMAGGKDGGSKAASLIPNKPAPQNTHPSAPGGRNYGAPIGDTILH